MFYLKTFAIKSCRNPTRHIFSWLPGEAVGLHTSVLTKTFAIKSRKNPAPHIFPWLPGEAVGLHTGVLTKMFAMSVLYLKTIDVFSKENRLISLYIKREKRKFAQTISFIQPYCEFIFI